MKWPLVGQWSVLTGVPLIIWSAGRHYPPMVGRSKYRLGLPSAPLHYGLMWPVGISTDFQTPLTVPLHSPNGRQMPAVRAVQGDCERVSGKCLPLGLCKGTVKESKCSEQTPLSYVLFLFLFFHKEISKYVVFWSLHVCIFLKKHIQLNML